MSLYFIEVFEIVFTLCTRVHKRCLILEYCIGFHFTSWTNEYLLFTPYYFPQRVKRGVSPTQWSLYSSRLHAQGGEITFFNSSSPQNPRFPHRWTRSLMRKYDHQRSRSLPISLRTREQVASEVTPDGRLWFVSPCGDAHRSTWVSGKSRSSEYSAQLKED